MGNNFYQTNNEILKLDPLKVLNDDMKKELFKNNNTLDLYFNHWISRKENLQRTDNKNTLDRGLFYLSQKIICDDFNITPGKTQRLLQRFEDIGIIECIKKGNRKGDKSVYAYTSVYYSEEEMEDKNVVANVVPCVVEKDSNCKGLTDTNVVPYGSKNNYSKKEKEKEKIKSNVHDNSLASTKKPNNDNNNIIKGKVLVRCRYKGIEVNANRFDCIGNKYRNDKNKYIEHDGFVYEIFESEVARVGNHWRFNECIPVCKFDGTLEYQSELPFKELKKAPAPTDANKKTNYDNIICKNGKRYSYGREVL